MLNNNEQKTPSKLSRFWLFGAFGSAVAATLCCLPALLFLLFGSSFGLLAIVAPLEKYRLLLSLLAFVCFAVFVWAKFYRKSCGLRQGLKGRSWWLVSLAFLALMLLLLYPEMIGVFYLYE
ncbi:hypothetical protein OURE66S_03153 [Oligella ureolytica]